MKRGFKFISDEQAINDFDKNFLLELPRRGTSKSAGYDFFAPYDFIIRSGETINIPTGIKAYMKEDEYLGILIRSSLGFKYNIRIVNQQGVIDSDYFNNEDNEGHIFVKIKNEGNKPVEIKQGEGIAQGIFQKYLLADGDEFKGEKRKGGIGSTSK